MSKIAMVSLKEHRYGGRLLKPGDRFEADGKSHARLLHAVKHADYASTVPAVESKPPIAPVAPALEPVKVVPAVEAPMPAEKPTEAPAVEPVKAPAPAHAATPDSDESATRKKRQYNRRDMTSEGSEG